MYCKYVRCLSLNIIFINYKQGDFDSTIKKFYGPSVEFNWNFIKFAKQWIGLQAKEKQRKLKRKKNSTKKIRWH